jgi:hypothetical protein
LRAPDLAQQLPDLVVGFNRHSPLLQHGPGADGDSNDKQRPQLIGKTFGVEKNRWWLR